MEASGESMRGTTAWRIWDAQLKWGTALRSAQRARTAAARFLDERATATSSATKACGEGQGSGTGEGEENALRDGGRQRPGLLVPVRLSLHSLLFPLHVALLCPRQAFVAHREGEENAMRDGPTKGKSKGPKQWH